LKSQANDLAWSPNGSLIATTTKDKNLSVFDPRSGATSLQTSPAHEGARQQKLTWLGDSDKIFTCGFMMSERQYAIWDVRNFATPVIKRRLDEFGSVPFLSFDEEHKIIFVSGKGESATSIFQYNSSNPNLIDSLGVYRGKDLTRGFSFLPKRGLDLANNEIAKGVRLTTNHIEYVSFKVPRRGGGFQPDLYPPIRSQEAAMTAEDYFGGKNAEALRVELTLDSTFAATNKSVSFSAAPTTSSSGPAISHQAPTSSPADKLEIEELNKKVKALQVELESERG
jgi:coronin-1B/1C/6